MKIVTHPAILLLWAVFILTSCTGPDDSALREAFLDPPKMYRMNQNMHTIPLDESAEDSVLQWYLDNGYGGFSLNVHFGHYLSDEGMQSFKRFCDKAVAEGMELWLYDELGYPSGNAGDIVIKTNPDWECQGLFFRDTLVQSGNIRYALPPGEQVMIQAFPSIDGAVDYSNSTDLMEMTDGPVLNWKAPEGDWQIVAVSKYRLYEGFQASRKPGGYKLGANYPSLMIPEVTEKFIEVTHEAYTEYMGEDLGKYFLATFTDEPSLMAVPFDWEPWAVIPWVGILSDEIENRYGYRPEEKLVELYLDRGPEGQEVRYHYYHTVADLIANNFFKPIKEWCAEHNFQSGGHLLLEETMMAHVPLYGDIMKSFREMHAPGIDILSCFPEEMPVHSPKLASSAMELTGNELVMSEPCPVADRAVLGGKETPAVSVRGHLNQLMLGGVTDFNNYLELSNSDQAEKNEFNTYVGRTTMLLRGGHTKADIGIVYPIESLWTEFTPRQRRVGGWDTIVGGAPQAIAIEQAFRNVSRYMYYNRWEYSYLDSRAISDSEVSGSKLVHDPLEWKVIILPAVSTLPGEAWDRLEEFVIAGGKLIALEKMPTNSEVSFPDIGVTERFADLFSEHENAVLVEGWTSADLDRLLGSWLEKEIKLGDEALPLRFAHREIDGRTLYYVINDSEESQKTSITLNTGKKLEEWDPSSGEIIPVDNPAEIELLPYHATIYRSLK